MAQLAFLGHATRGKEVIEILEMLGGENGYKLIGTNKECAYYEKNGRIHNTAPIGFYNFKLFSLEEFLEKFPYKVGDKVTHNIGILMNVVHMYWDSECNVIRYDIQSPVDNNYKFKAMLAEHLQPYKEEKMKEKLEQITLDIPKGYEFFGINDDNQVVLAKKQLQYPKTFIEVLNFWHPDRQIEDDYQRCYKKDLIEKFQYLLYARDAYWKIAGEQMGLGKPWKPSANDEGKTYSLCYNRYTDSIDKFSGIFEINAILDFPTKEMRDAFHENFKELINETKELL